MVATIVIATIAYVSPSIVADAYQSSIAPIASLALWACAILILKITIDRPLKAVFYQMKALLTGHQYKKIFTTRIDEVGVLAHFFNEVTKNMEKISVDVAEGQRLSKEVSIASDIQRRILPKELPHIPGLSIYGKTRPASEVGGDSFDVIPAPNNNTLIYVGDVTGHGLPAALIMVMVNTTLRTYSEVYANGYDIVLNTNRIIKSRIEPRRFMTLVLLRWNNQEQRLYYTGAGHEHIMLYRKKEGVCDVRKTGGIALGMVPDISKIIREELIPTETGDMVVLYSDGIIEAKNMQGEMFGLNRLKQAIEQYGRTSTVDELFTHISTDFAVFVGEQIQEDDITLLVIQRV